MNKTLELFLAEHEHKTWTPGLVPKNLWQSDWPWAPVFKVVDQLAINQELDKLRYFFVPHRDKDKINSYGHEGWSALTLYGLDYDKTEHFDQYGHSDESKYRWTEVCEYCPYIVNLIKSLPFSKYGRVRIMKLSAGGYIMPHTDGAGRIFGPLNFALTHPEGCKFVFKDVGTVPFKIGRGFMLDIGREHVVVNQSEQDRYHIIIHGNPTADITNLISDSIKQL
jgi:hypothetical protein